MGIMDSIKDAAGDDGALDKAKQQVNQHEAQVDQGIEKAGDAFDQKTDGKFSGQVDKGQSALEDRTGHL